MRVLDIFSGCGGLSFGFSKDKFFKLIAANDVDKNALESYKLNHKNVKTICKNIKDLDKNELENLGQIDIVLGGPPCQSYSTLGKRQMDLRANLFKEYLRVLEIINPAIFVFENVVGILSMNKGKLFKEICNSFVDLDYKINYKVLNAAEFGVPQIRERVIIVGVKNHITKQFVFPNATHFDAKNLSVFNGKNLKQFISIKEALDDLPEIKSGENGDNLHYKFLPNNEFLRFVRDSEILSEHSSPKNGAHLIKIMQTLKDGEGKDDLPLEIRPKSGYCNTYAKMFWEQPAPTITRNFATPSSSRCIHPRDSRALSIREGARLQSFPDSYKFYGSMGDKKLQIGNAVPPLLSIALAKSIKQFFIRIYNV